MLSAIVNPKWAGATDIVNNSVLDKRSHTIVFKSSFTSSLFLASLRDRQDVFHTCVIPSFHMSSLYGLWFCTGSLNEMLSKILVVFLFGYGKSLLRQMTFSPAWEKEISSLIFGVEFIIEGISFSRVYGCDPFFSLPLSFLQQCSA